MHETILMIHGMWAGGWYWKNYNKFFTARGYQCLTPTLRYHEAQPDDPPHPNLATTGILDYVSDLKEIVQNLKTIPILMGHSMGALLAQILATQVECKALVLIAPAAPRGIFSMKLSVIRTFWSCFNQWSFWLKPIRPTFKEIAYGAFQLMPYEEQKRMHDQFIFESGKAASEIGFAAFDKNKASAVDETRITCPTLILAGSQDRIIPLNTVKKIYKKYQHIAKLKIYEDHAHWLLGEAGWQQIAGDIDNWLQENLKKNQQNIKEIH